MPTYESLIEQRQIPPFAELYDIIFPDFILYLTPYPSEIVYNENTYVPCVMERSEIQKEQNEERSVVITFATKENIAFYFLDYNVPKIRVKITRYFVDDQIARVIFVGEGEVVGITDRTLTFKAVDILSLSKAIVPPLVYSSYCNNTIFDERCRLSALQFKVEVQVTKYNGNDSILYSSIFQNYEEDYFTYGYVEYNYDYRMITKHDNTNGLIYLHTPFDIDIEGKTVAVYPGCDKTPETCKNKFNNLENFLGFPYIPNKNPVLWGI